MKTSYGRVAWFCNIKIGDPSVCVRWAEGLLCDGSDTPNLRILAGLTKPLNSFEVEQYTRRSLTDLGIDIPTGDDAAIEFARELAQEMIADPDTIKPNLKQLFSLCIDRSNLDAIFDFYLLHCAISDLDYGHYQHYWDGLDRSNYKGVVREVTQKWLKNN